MTAAQPGDLGGVDRRVLAIDDARRPALEEGA